MLFKDITLSTPEENILYDNVLLKMAEEGKGGEVLRFWESPELFIVLGIIGNPSTDCHVKKVLTDRIPVLRRASGGGTVVQGKGCLNYSLILSKERPPISDLRQSYQFILGNIVTAIGKLGVEAVCRPLSDIALSHNNKKFSGNAQKRSRNFILHHGTLLYNFDLLKIDKYLKMPKEIPDYRQNRPHMDFVANCPVPLDGLKAEIIKIFKASKEINKITSQEQEHLDNFINLSNPNLDLNTQVSNFS